MASTTGKHAFNLGARLAAVAIIVIAVLSSAPAAKNEFDQGWRESFPVKKSNLTDTGRNTYFILEPGLRLQLEHGKDALTITVLDETKLVDGVRTRIVEERETKNGRLVEVSRNYFAIDRTTHDLYYFGEDVDMYENGKVSGHEGAWLSGVNGARFGLMTPGKPRVGDKYYQENAPGVARDRAEIVSTTEDFKVPAGNFKNCLHTRESSAIEQAIEDKWYAPNVGLIKEDNLVLVRVENGAK
ncbi:MAG TPA: hypothetical protein VGV87_23755 [Blastocatellia bacterium]|jgi:hypothetical protein|nr:hypothetical protein [Blastocatellia bacterium]